MFRVIGFAFLFPLALVILWSDAPKWAILGAWVVGFGLIAFAVFGGGMVLNCPYCGKGVKFGATACHHCGRTVTRGS